jgi:hypothetical protein
MGVAAPWKMNLPHDRRRDRRREKNPRILEYEYVAYLEDATFGTALK